MRKHLSLILLVGTLSAHAGVPGPDCVRASLTGLNIRGSDNVEFADCIHTHVDFESAATWLCNDEGASTSTEFNIYLEYRTTEEVLFKNFESETNRNQQLVIARQIGKHERDWTLFGYKEEVDSAIGFLVSAARACRN